MLAATGPQDPPRIYHSLAMLLRDGRVLTTGGNGQENAQIFSPPYLFQRDGTPARRPVIGSVPTELVYGGTFQVGTPDPAEIAQVSLLRLGAVTHEYDQNQRFVPLAFTAGPGELCVDAPASGTIAPPGDYMLFLTSSDGVPSVAEYVHFAPAG